jgi:catechol 2,3-dioxygenase-like lactoylglutathione lyase family enzyme
MMRLTVVKLFVNDQEEARRFYVERLGFVVAEDNRLGDYRWLLVSPPDTKDVAINLELAQTVEQQALVGRQGGGQPIFGLATDDCRRDYDAMSARGVTFEGEPKTMPYGTGVMLQDLYGNKLFLNEDR